MKYYFHKWYLGAARGPFGNCKSEQHCNFLMIPFCSHILVTLCTSSSPLLHVFSPFIVFLFKIIDFIRHSGQFSHHYFDKTMFKNDYGHSGQHADLIFQSLMAQGWLCVFSLLIACFKHIVLEHCHTSGFCKLTSCFRVGDCGASSFM